MLKNAHIVLAVITTLSFLIRAGWAFSQPERLQQKWVRILPHVIDTLLLVAGFGLVITLSVSITEPWLVAKMLALLAYIGFGVLTLRATGAARAVGFALALCSLAYLFAVALTKQPWPL